MKRCELLKDYVWMAWYWITPATLGGWVGEAITS